MCNADSIGLLAGITNDSAAIVTSQPYTSINNYCGLCTPVISDPASPLTYWFSPCSNSTCGYQPSRYVLVLASAARAIGEVEVYGKGNV